MKRKYDMRNRALNALGDWPTEVEAELRHLCNNTTLSYAQIANRIGERFPSHRKTRNAVLGKAKRLGLRPDAAGERPIKPRASRRRSTDRRITLAQTASPEPAPVILRAESDPGEKRGPSRRLSINDPELAERQKGHIPAIVEEKPLTSRPISQCEQSVCQWPTSTDVRCMEVCGEPATVGAYCARHAAVAYRVMPTKRRQSLFHKIGDYQHELGPIRGQSLSVLICDDIDEDA